MEEERFQQLLTALVVKKAKEMKPETYNGSEEDTITALNRNEEDKNQIMNWIKKLGESGELEQELSALEQEQEQMPYFKEGGKLDYLQSLKKGGKMKSKKCSCGCDLITKKEKGGKMIQSCACGCKPKLENGGEIQKLKPGGFFDKFKQYYGVNTGEGRYDSQGRLINRQVQNTRPITNIPSSLPQENQSMTESQWRQQPERLRGRFPNPVLQSLGEEYTVLSAPVIETIIPANVHAGQFNQTATPTKTGVVTKSTKPKAQASQPAKSTTTQPETKAQPNTNISVVDYLNSMGRASDRAARATLAKELGMSSYNFSASDNLKLLELIKQKGRNTGEVKIDYPTLAKPVNVPGMSIPVPKVQATPAVPELQDRQGFPTPNLVTNMYTQMYSTPQWQKDLINKK